MFHVAKVFRKSTHTKERVIGNARVTYW